jgi:fluoroquinolone transport system permease protein
MSGTPLDMKTPIAVLARGDLKLVVRDSTLVLALFGPLAITLLLWCLPEIEILIRDRLSFDTAPYRLFIVSFLSLIPGMLFAMIYGFIILDERDEDVIDFISITPLRKEGYLTYKLIMPMLLSAGFFLMIIYATALIQLNPIHAIGIASMVALEAAIGTLFLVTFSENKVEGLAFSKVMGIMYLAIPLVFFWNSGWHWLSAFLPPFWIAKAFIHSQMGSIWIWGDLFFGTAVHLAVLLYFLRTFLRRQ